MAEYYRNEIRSVHSAASDRRGLFGMIFDSLAAVLTGIASLGLFLALLVPCFVPEGRLLPVLGLLAPAIYLLTLCVVLYWIIRWRWLWVVVPLLLLLIATFRLDLFLQLPIRSDRGVPPRERGSVKVISYNVRQFYGPDGETNRDSLLAWVGRETPDVVCFQEFTPNTGQGSRALVDSLFEAAAGRSYFSTTGDTITSQAIYSRYRILRSGRTRRDMPALRSVWADLLIGEDTVRVFNCHLNSTSITNEDREFLTADSFLQDTAREEKVRSILVRYTDNSLLRASQADTIARVVGESPYRVVLCGDFNDTPVSYVYRRMRGNRQDAFSEAGRGFSYTFNGFRNVLRIDYVMLDPTFEVVDYRTPELDYSDHLPVVVTFKR